MNKRVCGGTKLAPLILMEEREDGIWREFVISWVQLPGTYQLPSDI